MPNNWKIQLSPQLGAQQEQTLIVQMDDLCPMLDRCLDYFLNGLAQLQ